MRRAQCLVRARTGALCSTRLRHTPFRSCSGTHLALAWYFLKPSAKHGRACSALDAQHMKLSHWRGEDCVPIDIGNVPLSIPHESVSA
jgi:hypothetical protein